MRRLVHLLGTLCRTLSNAVHTFTYFQTSSKTFLRAKAAMLSARLSHRNSVRPSVRHTGRSGKNGAS